MSLNPPPAGNNPPPAGNNPPPAGNNPNPQAQAQANFYQMLIQRINQPRAPTIKSIPCSSYSSKTDFDLWVVSFIDSVRASHGLQANDQQLGPLCCNWISTKLEVGETRSVYDGLPDATKLDWGILKPALSEAFKDEEAEIVFINDESSYKRKPGVPLRDYKAGLLLRMEKYLSGLKAVPAEWQRALVRRFRLGLADPVLAAHILMTCVGPKLNLDSAYTVATTYENTLQTIGQDNSSVVPNMASMLTIPQIASLSVDPPQLSALTTYQEKTNERLTALETSSKKFDLNLSEVKTGLTEISEGVKALKEDMAQRVVPRGSYYPREIRPLYPVARMPANPFNRPYYPSGGTGYRPQTVRGLTGGPGYMNRPLPRATDGPQNRFARLAQPSAQSPQIGNSASAATSPPAAQNPTLSALDESASQPRADADPSYGANPNVQCGSFDLGHGWVDSLDEYGYEYEPQGQYVYAEPHF